MPLRRRAPTRLGTLRRAVSAWDRQAFIDLSSRRTPVEDRLYRGLSTLGDHSSGWMAAAAAAAVMGGQKGRRTAAEVLVAVGLASFAANVVVKLGVRRRRPVSTLPILVRRPRSRSFPSGHSATSFAGATVLAGRYPAIAPVALGVAAGVAVSRVYVGVHYPIDVIAGATVGAAVGGGVIVAQRPFREPPLSASELESIGEGMQAVLVVNPNAGSEVGDMPEPVRVRELREGEALEPVLRSLSDEGCGVLGVAGGDGTVRCAAAVAVDTGRVLWVVPGGTLNHFAKALGAGDVAASTRLLEQGHVASLDVGEVGGDLFVNTASLGVYGDLVRRRERYEQRYKLGKWPALALAVAVTLRRVTPFEAEVDGRRERALLVFVGNNPYHGTISPRGRDSLQTGLLDVRVVRWRDRVPRLAVFAGLLTGTLERSGVMERRLVPEVTVRLDDKVALGLDGEVEVAKGDLTFRSRPRSLRVLVSS